MDLDDMLSLAVDAATAGRREVLTFRKVGVDLEHDGGRYFTGADIASERAVLEVLGRGAGSLPVLSEEGGGLPPKEGGPFWIVDPLDGTWNYVHGGSWWSVSIALAQKGRVVLGVVCSPRLGSTYKVHEGMDRPECNGRELRPDPSDFPGEWAISFGAPSSMSERAVPVERRLFSEVPTSDPLRSIIPSRFLPGRGSMALELCALAEGGLNAVLRFGQHCWDVAAGSIIASSAGCQISTLGGQDWPEEVRRFSRERTIDLIGASSTSNLALLRRLAAGEVKGWPEQTSRMSE